jgi:succinate dehydrogenase / fumarate reductase flavoprotein subunit
MWEHARLLRDQSSIESGIDELERVQSMVSNMNVGPVGSESFEFAIDVGFMLTVAESVLRSAALRTESRGAHYRIDHTETESSWQKNIYVEQADIGGMRTWTESVDTPSPAVQAALDEGHELDYHQLE